MVKTFEDFAKTMNNNANINFAAIKDQRSIEEAEDKANSTLKSGAVTPDTAKPVTPDTAGPEQTTSGFVSQMDPKKSYEQWVTDKGYGDLDQEYADAQNDLEYEFMKESANYGQKAEQLAQMGLMNSGVSDVYQLGAFQNYTQAQNDLHNALIEKKKARQAEYNAYSDEYDAALKAEEQAFNLQEEAKAQQKQQILSELYSKYVGSYSPKQAATIRADLAALGYGDDYADELLGNLDNTYNSMPETDRPDYFNAKQVAAGIELEVFKDADGNLIQYTGSSDQQALVRKYLEANGMGDKIDTVLAELSSSSYNNSAAAIDDVITATSNGDISVSASAYAEELKNIQNNSTWSANQKRELSNKLKEAALNEIDNIVNGDDLGGGYMFVGEDKATWDARDDGDKFLLILDKVGALGKEGVIGAKDADEYFMSWLENQIDLIKETEGFESEDLTAIVEQISEFANKGYISKDYYLQRVVNAFDIDLSDKPEIRGVPATITNEVVPSNEDVENWSNTALEGMKTSSEYNAYNTAVNEWLTKGYISEEKAEELLKKAEAKYASISPYSPSVEARLNTYITDFNSGANPVPAMAKPDPGRSGYYGTQGGNK